MTVSEVRRARRRLAQRIEEAKKGAPHAKDSFSAVESLVSLGQQGRRQEPAEELVQVNEALLA